MSNMMNGCLLPVAETVPAFRQSFKGRILKLIEDKYAFKRTLSLNPDFEKEWLYKRVCKVSHITKTASLRFVSESFFVISAFHFA